MPEDTGRKLNILVVDDEEMVCHCIRDLLSYDGHDVVAFTSSEMALAAFEAGKFDIVFLDYSMPGMKGDELALAINVIEPSLPIVMVTGNSPLFDKVPGVAFILHKPVMLDDLRYAIARVADQLPDHF